MNTAVDQTEGKHMTSRRVLSLVSAFLVLFFSGCALRDKDVVGK
jgi:hypothetical protein